MRKALRQQRARVCTIGGGPCSARHPEETEKQASNKDRESRRRKQDDCDDCVGTKDEAKERRKRDAGKTSGRRQMTSCVRGRLSAGTAHAAHYGRLTVPATGPGNSHLGARPRRHSSALLLSRHFPCLFVALNSAAHALSAIACPLQQRRPLLAQGNLRAPASLSA